MSPKNFWKKYQFAVSQTRLFKAGMAEVSIKHIRNGWLIRNHSAAAMSDELMVTDTGDFVDDSEVLHLYTGNSDELAVVPALPDKAVVFRNTKKLKVSPGASSELYFRIPLSIQFYSQEVKDENLLFEIPLKRLSDTWFGEIDNGEPAYSIGNNFDEDLGAVEPAVWEALCSVEIKNNTFGILDLQRLILRVEDFGLFLVNGRLLTSHVSIEFKGQEQAGSVNLSIRSEIHGEKLQQVAKPRSAESKNLLRRSFFFIKNMYQN